MANANANTSNFQYFAATPYSNDHLNAFIFTTNSWFLTPVSAQLTALKPYCTLRTLQNLRTIFHLDHYLTMILLSISKFCNPSHSIHRPSTPHPRILHNPLYLIPHN